MKAKRFLYIDSEVLPDYFEKVLATKQLLETGMLKSVTAAAKANGISRSTYYKYKDSVFESLTGLNAHCATFVLSLDHKKGVLSNVLSLFSSLGLNILTISQSLPVADFASVMISVDMLSGDIRPDDVIVQAEQISGVKQIQLLALS